MKKDSLPRDLQVFFVLGRQETIFGHTVYDPITKLASTERYIRPVGHDNSS